MEKTYTPRVGDGWTPYSLDNYCEFMEGIRGSREVTPLELSGKFVTEGTMVHHVIPEGVAVHYSCRYYSTGKINIALTYFGTEQSIRNLRSRIIKSEKKALSNITDL